MLTIFAFALQGGRSGTGGGVPGVRARQLFGVGGGGLGKRLSVHKHERIKTIVICTFLELESKNVRDFVCGLTPNIRTNEVRI